jgi:hypothetical protein
VATGVELETSYVSMAMEGSTLKKQLATEMSAAAGPAADKAGKDAGKRFGSTFTSAFKGAAAGIAAAFGTAQVVGFFKDSIQGAANLQQSIGAIDTVFKNSSTKMHAWAKGAAQDVGLSRNEFNELGTIIGSQLKNGGTAMDQLAPKTNELITLGADLAAMYGGTTADAVGALSSALKGERDPIERYGGSLNQAKIDAEAASLGFEKVGGTLSAEASQAATLSLIMKQTADAHGTFAKESDTLAGKQQRASAQWQDFKDTLGTQFLPIMTTVFEFINSEAIPALGKLDDAFKIAKGFVEDHKTAFITTAAVLTGVFLPAILSTAGGLLLGTAAMIANGVAAVATSIGWAAYVAIANLARTATVIWTGVQWLLNAALTANPIGLVVIAIAALVAGIIWVATKTTWFQTIWSVAWGAIKTAAMAVWNWIKANWPLLLAIITGPIGLAVLAIVKNWDKIKAGAAAVKNWIVQKFTELVTWLKALPGKISSAVSGMWDGIKSAFKSAINWVIGKWNSLEFGIPAFDFGGKHFDGFSVGTPNIPLLAEGGIITRPTLFMGGEGRESEAVLPLSKLDSLLSDHQASSRPIIANGNILGWIKEFVDGRAELVLNKQAFQVAR